MPGEPGDGTVAAESMLDDRAQNGATEVRAYGADHVAILSSPAVVGRFKATIDSAQDRAGGELCSRRADH